MRRVLNCSIQVETAQAALREHDFEENSTRPINQLPRELLCEIFKLVQQSPFTYFGNWGWVAVTRVCRYWRMAALSAGTLWAKINIYQQHDPIVPLSIRRSLTVPLKVVYFEPTPASANVGSLQLLAPHCRRLEHFCATNFSSIMCTFFQTPAPL